jgi:radical SAM superfamily enzyme YgiQ (UPF0313 family)
MLDVLLVGAEELENLSTRYLAAVLRQHGFSVAIAPFSTAQETGAVVRQAQHTRPRLIGLSIIFQYRAPEFLALAARLRDALPTTHITTGGHFPTFVAPELLRDYPALDSVVRGEGELTLLELVQSLDTPAAWGAIRGLTFRRDGQICVNTSRPLIADLDSLPFPARDTPPQHHLGIGFSPIVGSRGCYRNCAFCSIHAFYGASAGPRQRFRSVPNLVAEMEIRLNVLRAERNALYGERRANRINDESLRRLGGELDLQEVALRQRLRTARQVAEANQATGDAAP